MAGIDKIAKAVIGAATAGLGALAAVLVGDVGIDDVSTGQWVTIALATATALGAVYGVPTQRRRNERRSHRTARRGRRPGGIRRCRLTPEQEAELEQAVPDIPDVLMPEVIDDEPDTDPA